ncbi:MAG: YbaB/EbfC family nucleoid-associated protein [Rudaea sp.]
MSKGRGMGNLNPAALQKQLQEMQKKMMETQDALAKETVTSTVGGGAVTVTMTGQQKLTGVKIDAEALKEGDRPLDIEMLQDLIVAAVNDAIDRSQKLAADRMGAVTGGLGIPGF